MRKLVGLILYLLSSLATFAQSNTVNVQVVAPPTWTIAVAPANYYQSKAVTMTITVTVGTVVSSCTSTWDSTAMVLTFPPGFPAGGVVASPTTPVILTGAVTAAMTATLGNHAVVLNCPAPILSMGSPVTLPNAKTGTSYSASLPDVTGISGGMVPYTWTCSGLPTWLACASNGNLTGTVPSSVTGGSFNFTFTATDSSGVAMLRSLSKMVSGGA
jgi:hypothetical protein